MAGQTVVEAQSTPIYDSNYLQIKLDMQLLHRDIRNFLEGKEIVRIEEKGLVKDVVQDFGEPRANNIGIQEIYSFVIEHVNTHTLQANLKDDNALKSFMMGVYTDLRDAIHRNWVDWDIQRYNRLTILDTTCNLIYLTLTRTIGDKEREHNSMKNFKISDFTEKPEEKRKWL